MEIERVKKKWDGDGNRACSRAWIERKANCDLDHREIIGNFLNSIK